MQEAICEITDPAGDPVIVMRQGEPLPFVQGALGHASWDVTARHYAQRVPAAGMQPVWLEAGDVWPDRLALLRNVGTSDESAASPSVTRQHSPS